MMRYMALCVLRTLSALTGALRTAISVFYWQSSRGFFRCKLRTYAFPKSIFFDIFLGKTIYLLFAAGLPRSRREFLGRLYTHSDISFRHHRNYSSFTCGDPDSQKARRAEYYRGYVAWLVIF
jgi:hypothetical protein